MIIHKFKGEKYLQCQCKSFRFDKENWTIIQEKNGKFFKIEKAENDKILYGNLLFLKKNEIISWDFEEKIINFLSY